MFAHIGKENFEVWRDGNNISFKKIESNKTIHEFLKSQNNPIDECKMDGRKKPRGISKGGTVLSEERRKARNKK